MTERSLSGRFRLVALVPLLGWVFPASGQVAPTDELAVWGRRALLEVSTTSADAPMSDLRALKKIVGNARIVALSEALEGAAEPLAFRNRVFRYLVEELGFTAIVVESGLTEGRVVHDYVAGAPGDLDEVMRIGLHSAFRTFPHNRELVRWMREYNDNPRVTHKIEFFGLDVPGSPGNPAAVRGIDTGLSVALEYLDGVDPGAAMQMRERVRPVWPSLRFDPTGNATEASKSQYTDLSQPQRDLLTGVVADVVSLFERHRMKYTKATSLEDYQWAYQASIGARQIDDWLRVIPPAWTPNSDPPDWVREITQIRDRAMLGNMTWIVDQLGPDAKVLVFATEAHIAASPLKLTWPKEYESVPFGTMFKHMHRERVVTIGHFFRDGQFAGCGGSPVQTLAPAPEHTISAVLARLNEPMFLLDLRNAPSTVMQWLRQPRDVWNGFETSSLVVADAFDAVFFSDRVTPECH